MSFRKGIENFLACDIYGITDEASSLGRSNLDIIKQMLAAGIKVVQYREKNKKTRVMYEESLFIRDITRTYGATFIVNDHIDLALSVGADGVHIGQDDLPAEKVRALLGPDMLIGLSTHSPEQAETAASKGDIIDYIGVGPIYKTETKLDVCEPVGIEYLKFVEKNINLPYVAIGGIKSHNIGEIRRCGAKTISLVTELTGAEDIPAKIRELRSILGECAG